MVKKSKKLRIPLRPQSAVASIIDTLPVACDDYDNGIPCGDRTECPQSAIASEASTTRAVENNTTSAHRADIAVDNIDNEVDPNKTVISGDLATATDALTETEPANDVPAAHRTAYINTMHDTKLAVGTRTKSALHMSKYDPNVVPAVGSSLEDFGRVLREITNGATYHRRKLGWLRYLQGCVLRNYADTNDLADSSAEVATFARQFADIGLEYARKLIIASRTVSTEAAMKMSVRELLKIKPPTLIPPAESNSPDTVPGTAGKKKAPKRSKPPQLTTDHILNGNEIGPHNIAMFLGGEVADVEATLRAWSKHTWTVTADPLYEQQRDHLENKITEMVSLLRKTLGNLQLCDSDAAPERESAA